MKDHECRRSKHLTRRQKPLAVRLLAVALALFTVGVALSGCSDNARAQEIVKAVGPPARKGRVSGKVLKVETAIKGTNDIAKGMAADLCFQVRAEGWEDDIEIRGVNGHVLAWTGASNTGCVGR